MRLARRWVELWLLFLGVGCLWKGLHLPPPVANTVMTSGLVHSVFASTTGVNFSVSTKRFTVSRLDGDYRRLRNAMTAGREVTIEGWVWGGIPSDDYMIVASATADGDAIALRRHQLPTYWLLCLVLIGMGITLMTFGVWLLRRDKSVVDIVHERELEQPVAPVGSPSRERLTGLGVLAAGLSGVFGPILIGARVSAPLPIKFILAITPFAGLFATIVGSHRLVFARPLTIHDSPTRRIGFGSGVGCITLLAAAVVAAVLFDPK